MFKFHSALIQYHLVHVATTSGVFWWLDASNASDPPIQRVTSVSCFMTVAQVVATAIYIVQTRSKYGQSSQESSPTWLTWVSKAIEPSLVVIFSTLSFHLLVVLLGGPLIE